MGVGDDAEGRPREGAWVAEFTEHLDLCAWPPRHASDLPPRAPPSRCPVRGLRRRRLPPHRLPHQDDAGIAALELRHRRRARVEDQIRTAKGTGMRNLPFFDFTANQAWLELSLAAQDLLAHSRSLCLDGELRLAEPKRLRQRLLQVAGRIVRSGRRATLRLPASWPWAEALVAAFCRLRALPAASPA